MNPRSPSAPSPWVERCAHLVPEDGTVLDLACGAGRHTRFFADRGHDVLAIDVDISLLGALAERPAVEAVEADLETGAPPPFAGSTFAGVVVTSYLHRPLLPAIVAAVAVDGVLLYETFAQGNEEHGRPTNPDYLLRPGELREAVAGKLEIVAFEETTVAEPRPARVQRICARRSGRRRAVHGGHALR